MDNSPTIGDPIVCGDMWPVVRNSGRPTMMAGHKKSKKNGLEKWRNWHYKKNII